MKLKVHLIFNGKCEEALLFYKDILEGEVSFLFRKRDEETQIKELVIADIDREKISHMVIKTTFFELSGNDTNHEQQVTIGNNNKLILSFYDLDRCRKTFDALSIGGTITEPFEKKFFCEGFGELTDKFGIPWIIMMTDEEYEG
ncbi:VOC family protein [Dysgonomonas sp. Marseille-P4361]|uniref:VOC family protein n=1 Tax=Dysgonomonas sp. Marseille-P4361 TaxID=2161820 RepID=UPI000D550CAE|nr:VOC family protein [Dysgonomonas sp. Marseille-P4361]